jgi:dolichyl-diphosphooligosaccharide--protein glycosyltransferase
MGSEEEEAYRLARYLDANYILVIFGGVSYYSGDDISKFLWMIRIGGKDPQHDNSLYSWCFPSN